MRKTGYYLLALLFAAVAVLGLVFAESAVILTIIAVPAMILSLILGVCAGRKEGDIPFVGY